MTATRLSFFKDFYIPKQWISATDLCKNHHVVAVLDIVDGFKQPYDDEPVEDERDERGVPIFVVTIGILRINDDTMQPEWAVSKTSFSKETVPTRVEQIEEMRRFIREHRQPVFVQFRRPSAQGIFMEDAEHLVPEAAMDPAQEVFNEHFSG